MITALANYWGGPGFLDNVLNLLLHITFVFCEYIWRKGSGGRGGGWLIVTYFMVGCTAGCVTHCHKGVERGKKLAKTASYIL
jgi:hypothetical protein